MAADKVSASRLAFRPHSKTGSHAGDGMKDPREWEQGFIERLKQQPHGLKAWEKLRCAGLLDFIKFHLYCYAVWRPFKRPVRRGLRETTRALKKLRDAIKADREQVRGSRRKLEKVLENAATTRWPYENPAVKTLADASAAYPVIGNLTLQEATIDNGKARQNVKRYDGKEFLIIVRAGAKARGVHLTMAELVELAHAAREDAGYISENALQRFFAYESVQRMEAAFQRQFEASEVWDMFSIHEAVKQELAQASSKSQTLKI